MYRIITDRITNIEFESLSVTPLVWEFFEWLARSMDDRHILQQITGNLTLLIIWCNMSIDFDIEPILKG